MINGLVPGHLPRDLSVVHKDFTLFVTLTVQIHQQGSSKVVKKAGWHDVDLAEIDQVITDSDLPGETVSARPLSRRHFQW
jgi:hypothetical protein